MWPTAAIPGEAGQELPNPAHFEQLAEGVTEDQIAEIIPCGPDPEPILEHLEQYVDAGFDHVYLHQIGPDQEGFLEFASNVIPKFDRAPAASRA